MEEFLHKNLCEHSYDVYKVHESDGNGVRTLSVPLDRENCFEGGCDPGTTSQRSEGIDPPSPTLRPIFSKTVPQNELKFSVVITMIYVDSLDYVATPKYFLAGAPSIRLEI